MRTSLPRKPFVFVLVLFLVTAPAWAQWGTPVIDGVITPGEYGNDNTVGTNTAQNWYLTWDATNRYVGITKANLSEGAVIYIGPNPQSDPKCCSDSDGNLIGFTYDNTNFASLPCRAKFVHEDERPGHYGLRGMRERAKLLGGKLAVRSELDTGTEVELRIAASRAYETSAGRRRSWLAEKLAGKLAKKDTEAKS